MLIKTEQFNHELYKVLPMLLIDPRKPPQVKGSYKIRPYGGLITDIDVVEPIFATHSFITRLQQILKALSDSPLTFLTLYCGVYDEFIMPWTIDNHGSCQYDNHAVKVWYENLKTKKLVPESLLKEIKHNLFSTTLSLSNLIKVRDILKNYSRISWTEEAIERGGYTEFMGKKYTLLEMLQKGHTCIGTFLFRPPSQKLEFCTIDVGWVDDRYQKESSILIEYYNENIYRIFKSYKWFVDKKYISEYLEAANSLDRYTSLKSRITALEVAKNALFPTEIDHAQENILSTAKNLGFTGAIPEIQKKVQKEIEKLCKKYIQEFRPKLFEKYRNEVAVYEIRAEESKERKTRESLKISSAKGLAKDFINTCPFFEIPLPELQHLVSLAQRAQVPESALVQCVKMVARNTGINSFTLIRTLFSNQTEGELIEREGKKYYRAGDELMEIKTNEELRLAKIRILFS